MGNVPTATLEFGGVTYHVERTLGKGAYGKVQVLFPPRECPHLPMLVVKRMHKQLLITKGTQVIQALRFEKHVLSNLQHPLLVNLHATFQNENELFMVLDLMAGGDLSYWLAKEKRQGNFPVFSEDRVRFYAACLLLSLSFFHGNNIVHRDIKPDNIMLCGKGYAHLTDLNVSKMLDPEKRTASGFAGSPSYICPEMFRREIYNSSADMWSLGATLFEMLAGRVPWTRLEHPESVEFIEANDVPEAYLSHTKGDPNYERMVKRILRERISWPSKMGLSELCKDFITRLLCPASKRLSARSAMKHPWFESMDWDALFRMEIPAPFVPNTDTANADAHHMFEEVMGPKVKFRPLTDAEQAFFIDWDWDRQGGVLPGDKTEKPPKKSLLKTSRACRERQVAFVEKGVDLPELKSFPPFRRAVATPSLELSGGASTPTFSAASSSQPQSSSSIEQTLIEGSIGTLPLVEHSADQPDTPTRRRRSRKKGKSSHLELNLAHSSD